MTYHRITKTETDLLVGDFIGVTVTKEPPGFIITTHGTVDPGTDGGPTDTFVTASVDLPLKNMNGKQVVTFLNISTPTSSDLRSVGTETLIFDSSDYALVNGATITLIDAAGVSVTFTGRNDISTPINNEFVCETSSIVTGSNFATAVNNSSLSITASSALGTVTLDQDIKGSGGNTAITVSSTPDFNSLVSTSATEFTGGGGLDMFMEFSPDGTNWTKFSVNAQSTTGVTLAENIDTESTGYLVLKADLSSIKAPYARLGINSQGKSLGNLEFNMGYAFPSDYIPPKENEFWTTQGDNP